MSYLNGTEAENLHIGDVHLARIPNLKWDISNHLAH